MQGRPLLHAEERGLSGNQPAHTSVWDFQLQDFEVTIAAAWSTFPELLSTWYPRSMAAAGLGTTTWLC
jgi:hypothetical protein